MNIETTTMTHPDEYVVEFSVPYSFLLPDSIESPEDGLLVVYDGIPAHLRLQKVPTNEERQFAGAGFNVPRDRLGKIITTRIQIIFSDEFIEQIPDEVTEDDEGNVPILSSRIQGLNKYLVDGSVKYFNKFIEIYRVVTRQFWLRPLNSEEIHEFSILWCEDGEITDTRGIGLTGGMIQGGNIQGDTKNELQSRLVNEATVTLERELELDAQDKLDLGDYSLSIISSNRLFEVWIRKKFREIKEARGSTEEEAFNRIRNDDQYMNIKNICDIINSDLSFDFKSTKEYDNWVEYTYKFRNKVVHEEYRATELDAIYAYYYSLKAMERFFDEFTEDLLQNKTSI